MPRRSSQLSQSQPSTSQGKTRKSAPRNQNNLSQTKIDEQLIFSQTKLEDVVNNCVRYFVYNAGHNRYFTKADLNKHVTAKAGHQFQQIIEKTADILKDVYGYNLLVCDPTSNSSKAYILSNVMPYVDYSANRQQLEKGDPKRIVLLLILCHILMTNSTVTETSLYAFLSQLQIEVNRKHPIFGQVKDYIMNTLVKQKYLAMETDPVSKKISFSWGIRSEKEISRHEVLKFVCKIYNRRPEAWSDQFQTADRQSFENDKIAENNAMEMNGD